MSDRLTIVHAKPSHIRELADKLRADDLAELQSAGLGPMKALWGGYRASMWSKVAFVDGDLAAAWGLAGEPLGQCGKPWLLTAPPIERIPLAFVKAARLEVEQMLMANPVLWGFVDENYRRAIRFLGLLGFEISDEAVAIGPCGAPFRIYSIDVRN